MTERKPPDGLLLVLPPIRQDLVLKTDTTLHPDADRSRITPYDGCYTQPILPLATGTTMLKPDHDPRA